MVATIALSERVQTTLIDEKEILRFPEGIFGFEDQRQFILVGGEGTYPCFCLQSIADPLVAFTVIDPFLFFTDYSFDIPEADKCALQLADGERFVTLAIVSVPDDPLEMTANLVAPVIINPRLRIGRQVILQDTGYTVRHRILSTSGGRH